MSDRSGGRGLVVGAALLLSATLASAHVLDAKTDKVLFKLRADVASQVSKYVSCIAKATEVCEAKGASSSLECDAVTETVAYEPTPGRNTEKFLSALAKCDLKLDMAKKGSDYAGIGCPGDCSGIAGIQRCADFDAYEPVITNQVREAIRTFTAGVGAACPGAPSSPESIKCAADSAKQFFKYGASLSKCQLKCEADAKGNKGGGAPTNDGVCLAGSGSGAFLACEDKAAAKVSSPAAQLFLPAMGSLLDLITTDLFNRSDPTDPNAPDGTLSPCGTCGDDTREGAESCDGSDLVNCVACTESCTCGLPVCGNGVIEGGEACDGAELGACDACAGDCTCTDPVCGNGILESGEACDGAALGECDACASDCGCVEDPILDGAEGTFCSTAIDTGTANYQPLCVPSAGSGRHFRMEGVYLGLSDNGFVYLALGFPTGLESSATNPATPTAGDGRFIFTAGKSVSCTFSWNYFRYSALTTPAANPCSAPAIFDGFRDGSDVPPPAYPGPGTVCLDVTSDNPPRVTMWATGANGADCKDKSTLTALTAVYSKDDWASANNQPINGTTHYAKINNTALATMTTVAVSSNTVLP